MTIRLDTLDIGSGDHPNGTVNLDLLIEEDLPFKKGSKHYPARRLLAIPNFVKADAQCLPFKNKCFSKTFCYHVLEHIDREDRALAEMDRVTDGTVEIRVPYARFEDVINTLFFWKHLKAWRRKYHLRRYTKMSLDRSLKKYFRQEQITLSYGYIGLFQSLRFKSVRNRFPPLPFPWEIVAVIKTG